MKITVLGAGNGGYATAADMTLRGHEVTIFEHPEFAERVAGLRTNPTIEVVDIDQKPMATARLHRVASDPRDAVRGADVLLNPVPIYGYEAFARAVAPHLVDGQYLYTFGKGGGSLVYARVLREMGCSAKVFLGETNTLPYGATRLGDHLVRMEAPVREQITGSFPASNTRAVVKKLQEIYDDYNIRAAENVLETLLVDYNALTHVAPMICNAARIASRFHEAEFHLFGPDECPPPVVEIIRAVDRERMAIGKGLGLTVNRLEEEVARVGWGPKGRERDVLPLYDCVHSEKLEVCEGPYSLKARHLTEDVPYGLVAYCSLAKFAGVEAPVSAALVTIASVLNGEDYWKTGRSLEKMGIDPAWDVPTLRRYLEKGEV